METEMKDHDHGHVPPAEFLDNYLGQRPVADRFDFSQKDKAAFRKVAEALVQVDEVNNGKAEEWVSETDMYDKMVDAMQPFCPTLEAVNTGSLGDKNIPAHHVDEMKPDISLFKQGTVIGGGTDARLIETFLELKTEDVSKDGLDDNDKPFVKSTQSATATEAQMDTYAGSVMSSQFRTHLFSVWISNKHARLIRWDRGGAIVSQKFDYAEEPHLADFLWRFSFADAEARGHDPCIKLANDQDPNVERAKSLLNLKADAKMWKFSVFDEETETTKNYYGGKLGFESSISLVGRCTRGLVVVDEAGNLVYLKDTWRSVLGDQEKEGMVYRALKDAGVKGIPDVLAHGDAPGRWQETVTHKESNGTAPLRVHRHYFIVFKQVGRNLWDFKTTLELVKAIRDAVQAHKDALEKAKILHQDISVGNILITDEGGMLIDWDFSKHENDQRPRAPVRTGTWQFMSAKLLYKPPGTVEHERVDDLESFFHVLCWITLIYGPHELDVEDVEEMLASIYNYCWKREGGKSKGGDGKVALFALRKMAKNAQLEDGALKDLIVELEDALAVRYKPGPDKDQLEDFEETKANPLYAQLVATHPVQRYIDSMENLKQSDWMLALFDAAIAQPDKLTHEPRHRGINTT
uniref:Fungal-type protein kinase domain-containing protein n=1 Tax=Moniliophthora roreri TaxID=221103 RepID=A0A0W0F2R1_MONRR